MSGDSHGERLSGRLTTGAMLALAMVSALCPFATDMYAPGLPIIADDLDVAGWAVQLSMSAYLVGTGLGQLVFGPLSDALGRKPLLLCGSLGFAAASALCAMASSALMLDVLRFVQGFTGGAGLVIARAAVADAFTGAAAAKRFSLLGAVSMVAPVVAPLAGGAMIAIGSWRHVFTALSLIGLALLWSTWAMVPETRPRPQRRASNARSLASSSLSLLGHHAMVGHLLCLGLSLGGLFAYITGAPFVFQGGLGLTEAQYSGIFAVNALGTVASVTYVGRMAGHVSLDAMVRRGLALSVISAGSLLVLTSLGYDNVLSTWLGFLGLTVGFGLILPASTTRILSLGRAAPGAASGLLGAAQFLLAAVVSPLPGIVGDPSAWSTGLVMLGALLLSALSLLGTRQETHRACP